MERSNKTKIAIFVPWIKSKGGVERTILRFIEDKKYEWDIYTFFYDKNKTFQEFQKFNVILIGQAKTEGFFAKGINLFLKLIFTKIENIEDYDIFIVSTAGIAEFITFRNKNKKTIALCHTPLRVAHTMYEYYKNQSLRNKLTLPIIIPFYRKLEKMAWKRINYAIVLSQEVKKRIIQYQLLKENKIFNIGPSVNYSKIKNKNIKTKKIIFYPSRFIRYKRQDLAVKAFNLSGISKRGFKLIIAGFVEDKEYFKEIKSMENESISVVGNITEEKLNEIYSNCYATLFLAINEDTGLTPLESLAYGKPVISVNEGGPTEFIKNEVNGLLVNADEKDIADALKNITNKKLYNKLKNGAKKSKRYDERNSIKKIDQAIDEIIKKV